MPIVQTKYPVNIQPNDKPVFDIALQHYISEPELIVYKNCWWSPFSGKELQGFRARLKHLLISVIKMRPIKKLDKAAWVIDNYSGNYFHWINDVLPKIIFLQLKKIDCPVIIPDEFSKFKYVEESLQLLNISYLLLPKKGIYIIGQLFLPQVGASGGQDLFYFPLVQKKLKEVADHIKPGKKLFISRQKANTRNIISFEETEKIMKEKGFEIVYPEMLTFKEQSNLFSSATHLIGIHGAGLTNMIFMRSGSRVLEIRRNDDVLNYCYYFMASTLNLEYYYFMAEGAGNSPVVQEDNFLINISQLQQTLDNFLSNTE